MAEDSTRDEAIAAATGRIVDLEAELESAANVSDGEAELERLRALLHEWVDSVTAVVSTPGSGRVVLIHENGRESRISSPDLPYRLAAPVSFDRKP